jgi:hypothetical protein
MPGIPIVLLVGTSGRDRRVDAQDEFRAVQAALNSPPGQGRLKSHVLGAARAHDLTPALYEHRPTVVHIAGHGEEGRGVLLRTDDGGDAPVDLAALCDLIGACDDPPVDVVVGTSCHSDELARMMSRIVPCAVDMTGRVEPSSATTFSQAFHHAVSAGHSVQRAFDDARRNLALGGGGDGSAPTLHARQGIDPRALFLVPSHLKRLPASAARKPSPSIDPAVSGKRPFVAVVEVSADSPEDVCGILQSDDITIHQVIDPGRGGDRSGAPVGTAG